MRWMRVQQNSLTRSEEKLHRHQSQLMRKELRLVKIEKSIERDRRERASSAKSLQEKRDYARQFKENDL